MALAHRADGGGPGRKPRVASRLHRSQDPGWPRTALGVRSQTAPSPSELLSGDALVAGGTSGLEIVE